MTRMPTSLPSELRTGSRLICLSSSPRGLTQRRPLPAGDAWRCHHIGHCEVGRTLIASSGCDEHVAVVAIPITAPALSTTETRPQSCVHIASAAVARLAARRGSFVLNVDWTNKAAPRKQSGAFSQIGSVRNHTGPVHNPASGANGHRKRLSVGYK